MLKIGELSKLSRVSVRMLRHYDEIGLLKPAEIDRFTDYRYYREDQLPTAGRIAALKDMGFSLADITRILAVYDDREQLEQFFSARQKELKEQSRDTARKLKCSAGTMRCCACGQGDHLLRKSEKQLVTTYAGTSLFETGEASCQ